MEHIYGLAALWVALALLATFAATWLRISSTLCEIIIGIGAGFIISRYVGDTALGAKGVRYAPCSVLVVR